ncbi:hypothetical protein SAMN05660745_01774 [Corynebacterium glucuronolyticum]|nr:hypothetical protein CGLUCO_00285 [Corynebacterium glucuronolyticum DSM 44120]SMB86861.1 hypothetical protein SAMN05660745_01774 [Corynebacterium glucuronolyticum]
MFGFVLPLLMSPIAGVVTSAAWDYIIGALV